MNTTNLPRTCALIEQGMQQRWHMGVQLYIAQQGRCLANLAIGSNAPDQPLSTDTLMPWLSSGKPVTAVAILQLVERGLLSLDARLCDILPEFCQSDDDPRRHQVAIKHLLTHTVGLRPIVSGWPKKTWDDIVAKICESRLIENWMPGEMAGYDPARTWFLLGEIVYRITQRRISDYVREEILEPLQMFDCWMSLPESLHAAYGELIGKLYTVKDGQLQPTQGHLPEYCVSPSPGGSMRGPVSQLANFYEMLLNQGRFRDVTILHPETVQQMTARQRCGMFDQTFQHQVDFGWGVIINSNRYGIDTVPYGFGRHAGEEAFGHGGAQSSIGFADPAHQLIVTMVANGCPGEAFHNERFRELNSAIYQDLGLASH